MSEPQEFMLYDNASRNVLGEYETYEDADTARRHLLVINPGLPQLADDLEVLVVGQQKEPE